jgi:hypothetical protein
MKMMRYAEDDTKTDDQKQFWFMRGLHCHLRKGLKASEHKSLCHLVNRAVTLEEERRILEECMKGKKRMRGQKHHD